MRILIRFRIYLINFDADPNADLGYQNQNDEDPDADPGYQNHADP
jgi:hypothetical protein